MGKLPKAPKGNPFKAARAAPAPRTVPAAGRATPAIIPRAAPATPRRAPQPYRQTTQPEINTEKPRINNDGSFAGMKNIWENRPTKGDVEKVFPNAERTAAYTKSVTRWRQWAIMLGALTAFGLGAYGTMLYISITNLPEIQDMPADLSDRFDKEAEGYDEKVGMSEIFLLLNKRRKDLLQQARGHVLEVAVGTGRNTDYYPTKQCSTVTLLDSSGPMLAVAKRRWKDTHPEYFSRVFFKQQSAIDPITPPYGAQDGYDTVIQTMGLCSTPEPVKLLRSLEAATKEDEGRILLLEHGISHYEWLNDLLHKSAPHHALEHGCYWDKDIGQIVQESGLEVVELKRYNLGTTWWIELKPRKGFGKQIEQTPAMESAVASTTAPPAASTAQRSWWGLWR